MQSPMLIEGSLCQLQRLYLLRCEALMAIYPNGPESPYLIVYGNEPLWESALDVIDNARLFTRISCWTFGTRLERKKDRRMIDSLKKV